MSDKMRNLLVRTLSGAVLTVVVVGAVLWSQWSFGVLLLAILVGGMWEFYRMARREDIYPLKWLGLVTGTALFVASFLLAVSAEQVALLPRALSVLLWLLPVFILLIPLMFVCELFLKRARPAADVGATLGGVFYVAVPLSMMAYLPLLTGEGGWNPWVFWPTSSLFGPTTYSPTWWGSASADIIFTSGFRPTSRGRGSSAASSVRSPWAALPHGGSTVAIGCGAV